MIISQRTFILIFLFGVSNVLSETDFKSADILPYLNVLACSINSKPWECVYQRSGRFFDSIDNALASRVNNLKAEADVEYSTSLIARGLSNTEISELDKPSTVLTSLESYVKNVISSIMSTIQNDDESDEARKMKNKKKKKKPQVELVQYQKPEIYQLVDESDLGEHGGHFGGGHGGHHGLAHLGGHGLHKKKYGRSIGGKRGKGKKKKRRALMKILLIGAVLKAKIELLLKIIATHLQVKFFIIAVIGLIVNIARFWVDLKRGHQPQKVVYYEHAHHQHVYDEHDDGWGSGSYWKRSLATPADSSSAENVPVNAADRINISYNNNRPPTAIKQTASYSPANYRTYEEYIRDSSSPQLTSYNNDPHSIVYSQQMPQQTYSLN